jgi:hypothetical protein
MQRLPTRSVHLDRLWRLCNDTAATAEIEIDKWTDAILATFCSSDGWKPTQLRAMLRCGEFVQYLVDFAHANTKPKSSKWWPRRKATQNRALVAPFAADLHIVIFVDLGKTRSIVCAADLPALGLTEMETFQRAINNVAEMTDDTPIVDHPDDPKILVLNTEDHFAASRLIMKDWNPLVEDVGGTLIAAVPSQDIVLFAKGDDPAMAARLSSQAKQTMKTSINPLSSKIIHWNGTIWR